MTKRAKPTTVATASARRARKPDPPAPPAAVPAASSPKATGKLDAPPAAPLGPIRKAAAKPERPGVATGPGPRWLRLALVGLALVYYGALVHHLPDSRWTRPAVFFTEATALFPSANAVVLEFRLEAWACGKGWQPIDPRPYFPIQPDDKESRFQRLGYFYFNHKSLTRRDREAAEALDRYIAARHADLDDGVAGPIGGIRVVKVVRPFPAPGEPVERYHFDPFAQAPSDERREKYATPEAETRRRCASS
ncbi:MAG: hypothetical protein E6J90_46720 [Deltaproteobacteria bacterium]|nr:MAG: hypothetical protein E6J90_46720 [Deltaproteobacteria bacterium]TMQ08963.1 MAG: hypothetical protein E6J91_31780 [Deltaproteobacteria bacterium]